MARDESARPNRAAKHLCQTWRRWGVTLRPPVPESDLAAFEKKHQVVLPSDFREYLRSCNGFEGWGGSHGNDFRGFIDFLPLEAFERLPETAPNASGPGSNLSVASFSFADYLLSSHLYSIRLSADPCAPTPVVAWFGAEFVLQIATSFTEFVDVYVDEPDRLWPRV